MPAGGGGSVFTLHHLVDWNYHPDFPRARPNKWRVEVNEKDRTTFKEHSTALDAHHVPVYMERWQRYDNDQYGQKYFAAMQTKTTYSTSCGEPPRHAVLVVVGGHFACALDRLVIPAFSGAAGPAGPSLVDFALSSAGGGRGRGRGDAEAYLGLQGSYGRITCDERGVAQWVVERCTHPWREGAPLFRCGDVALSIHKQHQQQQQPQLTQ